MDSTQSTESKKEISLLDSLNGEWIKLPVAIMRDVGPAVQTLGGILKISNKETFVAATAIAQKSRLPVPTVRKHLVTLHDHGWISNAGRDHTRAGRARRTCTIKITAKTKAALNDYSLLPRWACFPVRLPWSTKVVLSVVMARLAAMKAAIERQDGTGLDAQDFWGSLENMGGDDRFRFSLDRLERDTGLSRPAVVRAKQQLAKLGIVNLTSSDFCDEADGLSPNVDFRVVVIPKSDGTGTLTFKVARG